MRGDRSCRRDPLLKLKRMVDRAAREVRQYEEHRIKVPGMYGRGLEKEKKEIARFGRKWAKFNSFLSPSLLSMPWQLVLLAPLSPSSLFTYGQKPTGHGGLLLLLQLL